MNSANIDLRKQIVALRTLLHPRLFALLLFMLSYSSLLSTARAVDPSPDGGYANGNTAEGSDALFSLKKGTDNTAIGNLALHTTTDGIGNTAIGGKALYSNTSNYNTATGYGTLYNNSTGFYNTANGFKALLNNTSGPLNTAIGAMSLLDNTTGDSNTATGNNALLSNTTGSGNTATGLAALYNNTSGKSNTAAGVDALSSNTTGADNVAIGVFALARNPTGSNNIAMGKGAGVDLTAGSNNIYIGNAGLDSEANTIRIGNAKTQTSTFIAGISGTAVPNGASVIIGSDGKLGTVVSSARFKEQIKPMEKASEVIYDLCPVTFEYKRNLDPEGTPQFGLVAEQVERVDPDLVARDEKGKAYTVRYEAVNAMLLNEFLKEHRKIETQAVVITEMKSAIARQQKQIESLNANLHRVSDELEQKQAAPTFVNN